MRDTMTPEFIAVYAYLRYTRGRDIDIADVAQMSDAEFNALLAECKPRRSTNPHEFRCLLSYLRAECRRQISDEELAAMPEKRYQRLLREMIRARRYDRTTKWIEMLTKDKKGNPLSNLTNAIIAFRFSPLFRGVFRWNEFAQTVEVAGRPPWLHDADEFTPHPMGDVEFSHAQAWLQGAGCGMLTVNETTTRKAVIAVAHDDRFHPVLEYLEDLEWDGTARIDTWLIEHLGAEDNDLNRAMGSKFLIGAVARVMDPGCKLDTMLILEGPQGLLKSQIVRALGYPWFTDNLPDISSKDAMVQLQGNWIIESAEMDSMQRADANRLKQFLSRQSDDYRPPYGFTSAKHPRQCAFFGTINPGGSGYLRDETGARRFWTVACGVGWPKGAKADVEAVRAIRGQLWAEAVARYQAGEKWWLESHALELKQEAAADARYDDDPWTGRVLHHAASQHSVTTDEILEIALSMKAAEWTRAAQMRVGGILRRAGWRREKIGNGARKGSFHYLNPTPPEPIANNVVPLNSRGIHSGTGPSIAELISVDT